MDKVFEYLVKRFQSEIKTGSSSPAILTGTAVLLLIYQNKIILIKQKFIPTRWCSLIVMFLGSSKMQSSFVWIIIGSLPKNLPPMLKKSLASENTFTCENQKVNNTNQELCPYLHILHTIHQLLYFHTHRFIQSRKLLFQSHKHTHTMNVSLHDEEQR